MECSRMFLNLCSRYAQKSIWLTINIWNGLDKAIFKKPQSNRTNFSNFKVENSNKRPQLKIPENLLSCISVIDIALSSDIALNVERKRNDTISLS